MTDSPVNIKTIDIDWFLSHANVELKCSICKTLLGHRLRRRVVYRTACLSHKRAGETGHKGIDGSHGCRDLIHQIGMQNWGTLLHRSMYFFWFLNPGASSYIES